MTSLSDTTDTLCDAADRFAADERQHELGRAEINKSMDVPLMRFLAELGLQADEVGI